VSGGRPWARALRPSHWWKNVPVAAPLVFGGRLSDPDAVRATAFAFVAFCAVASAGYLVNDVVDRAADRLHPARRLRPVAAGLIAPAEALVAAAGLLLAALAASLALLPPLATAFLGLYALASLAYTFVLRRTPGIGPAVVALGFVLRVLCGAAAADVVPSLWLVTLTFVLALALAVAKREAERRRRGDVPRRLALGTDLLLASAGLGYVAWTLSPATAALHRTRWLAVTAVPVVLALAVFRRRLRADREGRGPAELVASDPLLLALGAAWAALSVVVVGRGP
jgi:4-hydroxybenzoate polyprenyltransferase